MCGVIVIGLFSYNIIKVLSPYFALTTREVRALSSNDEFQYVYGKNRHIPEEEEKITNLREREHRLLIDSKRHEGFQRLFLYGIIVTINFVIYMTHWKIGMKSIRESSL
jgi:hypothetical protein